MCLRAWMQAAVYVYLCTVMHCELDHDMPWHAMPWATPESGAVLQRTLPFKQGTNID